MVPLWWLRLVNSRRVCVVEFFMLPEESGWVERVGPSTNPPPGARSAALTRSSATSNLSSQDVQGAINDQKEAKIAVRLICLQTFVLMLLEERINILVGAQAARMQETNTPDYAAFFGSFLSEKDC